MSNMANGRELVTCLQVVVLSDSGDVPLKFQSTIQDSLNNGDIVNVTAVYFGTHADNGTLGDILATRVERLELLQKYVAQPSSRQESVASPVRMLAALTNMLEMSYL